MKIDWYEEVLLKDGRSGCVIEIFEAPDGDRKNRGYLIELSDQPDDSETITVKIHEIAQVLS